MNFADKVKNLQSLGIPFEPASQTWFKDYMFKVLIPFTHKQDRQYHLTKVINLHFYMYDIDRLEADLKKFNKTANKCIENLKHNQELNRWCAKHKDQVKITLANQKNGNYVYCKNIDIVKDLVKDNVILGNYKRVQIHGPINEDHISLLANKTDSIVLRKSPYYGKYYYRLKLKSSFDDNNSHSQVLKNIIDTLHTFGDNVKFQNLYQMGYPSKWRAPLIIYFTDAQEFTYIKMMATDLIIDSLKINILTE